MWRTCSRAFAQICSAGNNSQEQILVPSGWLLAFTGRHGEASAARAPAPAEPFAFFGAHLVPLFPATAPSAIASARAPTAEQDATEQEQAESLPEGDHVQAENRWQKPVP